MKNESNIIEHFKLYLLETFNEESNLSLNFDYENAEKATVDYLRKIGRYLNIPALPLYSKFYY